MNSRPFVWVGMFVGSMVGAYVPALWGDTNIFSIASMFFGAVGAIAGIYVGFKMSQY